MSKRVNFKNGLSSFGVPVGTDEPIFGNIYYVDGTNGNDSNKGDDPSHAFVTIQAAITKQIADAVTKASLGDVIYVLPGIYAESLTGNLAKVRIIGVGRNGVRPMAKIHPVATAAYTGEMLDAGFENLEFASPSAPTANCAAIIVETSTTTLFNMANSYIDNCFFTAGAIDDTYESMGIVLGALAAANTTYEFADYSRISGNTFGSVGGRTKELTYGICLGTHGTSEAGAEYKGITGCDISYNDIRVVRIGIEINAGCVGTTGTRISHNHISSNENAQGVQDYGIRFQSAAADQLCFVTDNRIITSAAASAAIYNASTVGFVQGNIIFEAGVGTYALPVIAAA